ncbi:hypothetical protein B4100_2199 [Heyndrickxia coagulans]|nr:hypothetical protein B4100_2199 [Heyndrickxia coagulans]
MGYKNGIVLEAGPFFLVLAALRTGRKKRGRPPLQQPSFYHI